MLGLSSSRQTQGRPQLLSVAERDSFGPEGRSADMNLGRLISIAALLIATTSLVVAGVAFHKSDGKATPPAGHKQRQDKPLNVGQQMSRDWENHVTAKLEDIVGDGNVSVAADLELTHGRTHARQHRYGTENIRAYHVSVTVDARVPADSQLAAKNAVMALMRADAEDSFSFSTAKLAN